MARPLGQIVGVAGYEVSSFQINELPGCPLDRCRGIQEGRTVSAAVPYRDHYEVVKELPQRGMRLTVRGVYSEEAEEGSDFRALIDGYVSVGVVRNIG